MGNDMTPIDRVTAETIITKTPSLPMVLHAITLARAGRSVIQMHADKRPMGNDWQHRATTDVEEIGRRWQATRDANVGYTLPGLVAVDVDTAEAHGSDGHATWAAVTSGRALPDTWTVRTPSGGLHVVYELPDGMIVKSRAEGLGPGLDVRSGAAACLVGPGSRTDRGTYFLADDTPPAPLPTWLGDELRRARLVSGSTSGSDSGPAVATVRGAAFATPDEPWEPLGRFGVPIPEGQRSDMIHRYACSLRARRNSRDEAEHLVELRFRDCAQPPGRPYTWAEARAAIDSAWKHPSGSPHAAVASTATKRVEGTGPPVVDPAMFHGVLGEMVHAAEPHTEADPVGVLVSLLAGVGVFLGRDRHLMIGSTRHPLLIWPLLFGGTGTGRKGESGETARLFLLSSYTNGGPLMVSGLSSGEGLIERIRDQADENDIGGSEDKRLLVTEPEFSTVMARAKREGSTLAAVLRQAWDGRSLSVLNRSALNASSSHVSIVGHVTPGEFRMRLAESEMAGGTYNRFLPVFVERSKRLPMPEPIPPETLAALAGRLGEVITNVRSSGEQQMRLGADARARWVAEVYDELTAADDDDAAWSEFTRRAAPYCMRIAALFAVLDGHPEITVDHLVAALALVRYSINSARYVLAGRSRNPRMDTIRRAIDGSDNGLTRTEISSLFSRNVPAAALDELLDILLATGDYAMDTAPTGGRPAQRYHRTTPIDEERRNNP